jgi:hypothetical protein
MSGIDTYRIVIHPGFAKAMTTFVQEVLFCGHSQINHIGKQYWDDRLPKEICYETADLIREIAGKDTIDYDAGMVKESFDRIVEHRFVAHSVNTLSDEALTYACNADRQKIASRLKALMPDARVLFTIRNQFTLLVSAFFWLRFTKLGIPRTFSGWLRASKEIYNDIYDDFFLRQYRYFEVVEAYKDIFGKDNILVLPIESFATDHKVACVKIADFMGVESNELYTLFTEQPKNVRHSSAAIAYFRFCSKLKAMFIPSTAARDLLPPPIGLNKRMVDFLDQLFPAGRIDLDSTARQFISDYYKAGNRKLSREYELPLETYGYPIEQNR